MCKILYLIVAIFMSSFSIAQGQVNDPTKPLNFSEAGGASGNVPQTIQLTSILISSERKVAIINGTALIENQTITGVGARVKKIDADAVTLQQNGKIWRVALNNTAIRK